MAFIFYYLTSTYFLKETPRTMMTGSGGNLRSTPIIVSLTTPGFPMIPWDLFELRSFILCQIISRFFHVFQRFLWLPSRVLPLLDLVWDFCLSLVCAFTCVDRFLVWTLYPGSQTASLGADPYPGLRLCLLWIDSLCTNQFLDITCVCIWNPTTG